MAPRSLADNPHEFEQNTLSEVCFVKFIDGDYLADFGIDITLGETV